MMTGSMFRWRTKEKEYNNHKKSNRSESCDFCQLVAQHTSQVVEETQYCLIIKNRFGYDFWDGCGVSDHLMVILIRLLGLNLAAIQVTLEPKAVKPSRWHISILT